MKLLDAPSDTWMNLPDKVADPWSDRPDSTANEAVASKDLWPLVRATIDFFLKNPPPELAVGWQLTPEYSDLKVLDLLAHAKHIYEDLSLVNELIYQPLHEPIITGVYEFSGAQPINRWQAIYLPIEREGGVFYRVVRMYLKPHPTEENALTVILCRGNIAKTDGQVAQWIMKDKTSLTLQYVPGSAVGEYGYHQDFNADTVVLQEHRGTPIDLSTSTRLMKKVRSSMQGGEPNNQKSWRVFGDPAQL